MMTRLLVLPLLSLLMVEVGGGAWASAMGSRSVPCSYTNLKHPSLAIRGTCKVHYGLIGSSGQGYRRVIWPDGVITLITISADGTSAKSISAMVDRHPATAVLTCGQETYTVYGNTIVIKGNLCQ
jgi:hypothetical protein